MKIMQSEEERGFVTVKPGEEMFYQPLYHYQAYPTTGALSFTYFQTPVATATNGAADTNMENSGLLSAGKRALVTGVSVVYIPGPLPTQVGVSQTVDSPLNDMKKVLDGLSYFQFQLVDKIYLTFSPLSFAPAGFGVDARAGGIFSYHTLSDTTPLSFQAHGTNGVPAKGAGLKLPVPLPIPSQAAFKVTVTFPALITVLTAGRLGIILDCIQIRVRQ